MVLVKNLKFFPSLFLDQIGPLKVFHDVLDRKLASLDDKNIEFKKWQNLQFSEGVSPWFWSKICIFLSRVFRSNELLDRKSAFQDDKNIKLKKWQNLHFCLGVSL